ncbi:23S rRNA (uracil(1939)-C(5))-methyltransferase RlmD [Geotalea sp. SG265]|uniref:23S rRNA (uracil(1939)-C(5))-methyltransferase RlmD n=1 Tax=Geotalea sp. SG265 TaxID=2922867 RepID=UPI001FAF71F1|nr:23S rRNA (uracil(1939)-C(5))-methyltransferase RlmD [Geotalea sp. SG265]
MRQIKVAIEKLANGGAGFGRCDGKAFFVPFTAPGDVALVRTTVEKSSYAEGALIDLLTTSNQRVAPPCPIFGVCGGCNWQHVAYASQLREKSQIFADLLWRSARVEPALVSPVIPAPEVYGYRSRVQVKVHCHGGKIDLGFYRPKSHQVVDWPGKCAISHRSINLALECLRQLLQAFPGAAGVNQVDLARSDDDHVSVVFTYTGNSPESLAEHLLHWEERESIGSAHIRHHKGTIKVFGEDPLSYRIPENTLPGLPERTLFFSTGAFSQINYRQNLQLIRLVAEFAALTGTERVLDLFCGNGNFSIPLAHGASHVTGYEGYEPSVLDGKKNAVHNGVENISFHCSDAAAAVRSLAAAKEIFEVIVLDPPRSGAAETVSAIRALQAEKIIYVSCDPATLARDLNILKNNGFHVRKSQGVDMFPQTYHLESVTLLTKS